ncbi:lytic transglycosylase domain-containing protein [Yunchengibacter salinarum]|uniref:lytic transglycosylase domain-containing protein n=1 Tax=Yunchengibacter salinarum TaxID=3133399 RepID=UPI0035B69B33
MTALTIPACITGFGPVCRLRAALILACALVLTPWSDPARAGIERIPRVLSEADIQRYHTIFELQADAKWEKARRVIRKLDKPLLMGHVDFQRLMHPTGYRSPYHELAAWLKDYADHPSAWRVYRLARRRQGNAHPPRRPEQTRYPGVTGQSAPKRPEVRGRSRMESLAVRRFENRVRRLVRAGRADRAEKRYWAIAARNILSPYEEAGALERIASGYYYDGRDFKAQALASRAAEIGRHVESESDWVAGLAHWRLGNMDKALTHFSYLGDNDVAGPWLGSAGSFWASRAAYRLGKPAEAERHLRDAARRFETFYGLIASRQLGMEPDIDWTPPPLEEGALQRLLTFPATRRAIALTEVGRDDLADEELRLLWGREGAKVQEDLLAFAAALNLPAIQLRLGRAGTLGEQAPTAVRYPMPDWEPQGGFILDRALLFAMMRQESNFKTRARSSVGARGLMQVMPATASYLTRDRSLYRRNRNQLYRPSYNMALGQQYVDHLLEMEDVEANLFMLLAAYNGGPGTLHKWKETVAYSYDPLLFIESISFHQTRHYIEKVMANLWLYRKRLGQPTPSLTAIAEGAWPAVEFVDDNAGQRVQARRRARLERRRFEEDE